MVEVWPAELGSASQVNISLTAGSDVTAFVDFGNGEIEERFIQEAEDFQADPLPFTATQAAVGSYTIEIHLANRYVNKLKPLKRHTHRACPIYISSTVLVYYVVKCT